MLLRFTRLSRTSRLSTLNILHPTHHDNINLIKAIHTRPCYFELSEYSLIILNQYYERVVHWRQCVNFSFFLSIAHMFGWCNFSKQISPEQKMGGYTISVCARVISRIGLYVFRWSVARPLTTSSHHIRYCGLFISRDRSLLGLSPEQRLYQTS